MRKIFIPFMLALVLSACGVTSGEVIDKHHEPAHTIQVEEDVEEQECEWENKRKRNADGTYRTERVWECEMEVVGTRMVDKDIPDEYTLTLRNEDGDEGTVDVSESEYNSVDVGDHYED